MRTGERLWVVIPVYNEEHAVAGVLADWAACLRGLGATICVVDDGSTDGTAAAIAKVAIPELVVIAQDNRGHGRACLRGYRAALDAGADWVLQVDSDGQCDPRYFARVWARREPGRAVYGFRAWRADGVHRWLMSRAVSAIVAATLHVWVPDPNVPYRLIHRELLRRDLPLVTDDTTLPNVALAALHAREIAWVPIGFRRRTAGSTKTDLAATIRLVPGLVTGLRNVRARRYSRG
jgi:glycosyltransferase involved in cell wall biosynthesis